VPAIILYEVYKILKGEVGEEKALLAAAYMKNSPVIPLNETLALAAADIALQENLAMAEAIIAATARAQN
jgi:toxin FitB